MKPEQVAQVNFINWINYHYPDIGKNDTHHFANERKCTVMEGRLLKRMGVTKGVADIFVGIPQNGFHGLWIELKVGKGKVSREQKAFLENKVKRGYYAVAVWGEEGAKDLFLKYFGLEKPP